MYKYAQLKRFHSDRRLKVYMYDFMYVDTQTIPMKNYFPASKIFVVDYNEMSTPGPVPKHFLGLSCILSEDYELDQNFDYTELKKQSDNTYNHKVDFSQETVVVIEE